MVHRGGERERATKERGAIKENAKPKRNRKRKRERGHRATTTTIPNHQAHHKREEGAQPEGEI